jgi:hypothetical protein
MSEPLLMLDDGSVAGLALQLYKGLETTAGD